MVTNKINLNSASESYIDGFAVCTRSFVFILMVLALLMPAITQADGLFDFQMKLAKKGNAEAEYKVGEMYETGFGVTKDMNAAMTWITKSANQGHETAAFKLLYWDIAKNGVTKANKAKVDSLVTKAKEGNPQAQYYVGKMHAHGVGVKKNSDNAIAWLNKAALVGVLEAERELTAVRENRDLAQQKAKRRADEKKRAEIKAKQEQEKQTGLEKQRKSQEKEKEKEKEKAKTGDIAKQKKAATNARLAAEKKAADKAAQQAKVLAQREAAAKQREAQKQALIKKRAADQKKRKTQFESDPCSGKSARFLSTCK